MKTKFLALTATVLVVSIGAAFAHGGATGIVKQRMDGMVAMGKALAKVADMFKGVQPYNQQTVVQAAEVVQIHAIEMKELFPDTHASRMGTGTEALPSIWQNLEDFMELADRLDHNANQLKLAAGSGSQSDVQAAFGKVARTCSACHRDYRKVRN